MRLTPLGRWVFLYLPALLLTEAGIVVAALAYGGPTIFQP